MNDENKSDMQAEGQQDMSAAEIFQGLVGLVFFIFLIYWAYGKFFGDEGSATDTQAGGVESELRALAIKQIEESEYSFGGPGGLCDKVTDKHLADVKVGTISKTQMTGTLAAPIPAIIARLEYTCVISALAKKERQNHEWVVLALDKEFGMLRCMKIGTKSVVTGIAEGCGFK